MLSLRMGILKNNGKSIQKWKSILLGGIMENAELRKVDSQGRIVLPADWRASEIKHSNEVIVIKYKGYLKIIPKKNQNFASYFDSVEFENEIIEKAEDWSDVEQKIYKN